MEEAKAICLSWLQLCLLVHTHTHARAKKIYIQQTSEKKRCGLISPNVLQFLFVGLVFVKFTL